MLKQPSGFLFVFFDKLINIVVEESGLPRLIWDQEASKDHTWVRIPPTILKLGVLQLVILR